MIGMVAENPKDDNTNEIGGALIAFSVGKLRVGGKSQFQQPEAMKEITGNWQDGGSGAKRNMARNKKHGIVRWARPAETHIL